MVIRIPITRGISTVNIKKIKKKMIQNKIFDLSFILFYFFFFYFIANGFDKSDKNHKFQ